MDKFMDGSNSLNLQPTACILGRGARERRHADLVTGARSLVQAWNLASSQRAASTSSNTSKGVL